MLEKRRTLCLIGFTYLVAQLLAGFMPSVAFGPLTAVFVYRKPPAVPGSSQKALALHRK